MKCFPKSFIYIQNQLVIICKKDENTLNRLFIPKIPKVMLFLWMTHDKCHHKHMSEEAMGSK